MAKALLDEWMEDPEFRRESLRGEFALSISERLWQLFDDANRFNVQIRGYTWGRQGLNDLIDQRPETVAITFLVDIFAALGRRVKIVDEPL